MKWLITQYNAHNPIERCGLSLACFVVLLLPHKTSFCAMSLRRRTKSMIQKSKIACSFLSQQTQKRQARSEEPAPYYLHAKQQYKHAAFAHSRQSPLCRRRVAARSFAPCLGGGVRFALDRYTRHCSSVTDLVGGHIRGARGSMDTDQCRQTAVHGCCVGRLPQDTWR